MVRKAVGDVPETRKGQDDLRLTREQFTSRFRQQFYDPAFDGLQEEIERLAAAAWDGYEHSRKSPRTRKAGPSFADPSYDMSVEWLATRQAVEAAERRQRDPASASRVLLISGAARNDQTCPGETPKSYRLMKLAQEVLEHEAIEADCLDLSGLADPRPK